MQIIAGNFRGTRLHTPEGMVTRPTLSRVKEAFFNVIQNDVSGCSFLDVFAGTGQMGIEAISRGASYCAFIDTTTASLIKQNIQKLKIDTPYNIFDSDATLAITSMAIKKFDFVYLDPPHEYAHTQELLELVHKQGIVADGGTVVLEWATTASPLHYQGLTVTKSKKYGNTTLFFYKEE